MFQHVVLGVGGATDIWDPDEQDFLTPTEIPEPKTRAAKQKLLEQEAGGQLNLPLLTLVRYYKLRRILLQMSLVLLMPPVLA